MKTRAGLAFAVALFLSTLNNVAHALDALAEAEDRRLPLAPALVAAQVSPAPALRIRAARALGRIQKPEGVTPLLALLKDKSILVREEAAFALGQLAWETGFAAGREAEIASALSLALQAPESRLRALAAAALGKIGLQATPALVAQALEDKNSRVRAEALMALYRHRLVLRLRAPADPAPELPAPSVSALVKLSTDSNAEVRRNVAYVLARVKITGSAESVGSALATTLQLSKDPSVWVRFFGVTALARQDFSANPAEAVARAVEAARDSRYFIRVAALQALAALKTQVPASLAAKLAKDSSHLVRSTLALGSTDVALLHTLAQDESVAVRADALRALVKAAPAQQALSLSQAALSDPSWVVRQAAVDTGTVALSSDTEKLAFLAAAGTDGDVRVRASAIDAYVGITGATAFQAIRAALASNELSERGSAAGALSSRPEPEVAQAAWDCFAQSSGEKWVEVREGLVGTLAAIPGDATTAWLKLAATDPAPSVAGAAIRALTGRGLTGLPALPAPVLSFSPDRELKFKRNPKLFMQTSRGTIQLELFPKAAPIHVANLVGFVSRGGYDGLPIHRVVPNFVIQGGDPDRTGWGSAGYSLRAEINGVHFKRGALGMPRGAGFDTGGIQFFISHVPTPHLDGQYTVFGQVRKGMKVVDDSEIGDLVEKAWITQ